MVQPDTERQLDDVILTVFEQAFSYARSSRHFYFPVTSQREARAFVDELHRQGVHYQDVCAAVGEFEQNFTSWRKGLNRPSVGNRVVERINRPLQQLLLAADDEDDDDEDDDDDDDGLCDVEDDDDLLAQFTSSIEMTPSLNAASSPVLKRATQRSRQRDEFVTTSVKNDLTTVSHSDDVRSPPSTVDNHSERSSDCDVVCTVNEENNNDSSCVADDVDDHQTNRPADTEHRGDELDRAQEEELLRLKKAAADVVVGVITAAVDVVKGSEAESAECSWVTELSVHLSSETSVEQRQISVTSASTTCHHHQQLASHDTTSTAVHHRPTDTPEVTSHTNDIVTTSVATTASDSTAALSELTTTEPRPPEVNGHVTSQPETQAITADEVDNSVEPEVVLDQRDETPSTAEPEVTSSTTVTSETGRQCVRRARITADDHDVNDVRENYDSSDDDDVTGSRGQGQGRGGGWRGKRGGQVFEDDGPGYVYVFTDTASEGATQCRVKVSASRRPEQRLRQAQLFNVDMRLVTAVRVSRRLAAACHLREQLVDSAIPATLDWFNASLDVVIAGVMDVVRHFPPPPAAADDQQH